MLHLLLNITQSINRRVYQTPFLFPLSVHHWQINNTSFAAILLVWYTSPIDAVFYWLLNIKQSIRRRVYQTLFLLPLCCPPLQTNNIYTSYFKSYFFVHYTSPIDAVYFLKINKASEGEYIKQYLSFHCPPLTNVGCICQPKTTHKIHFSLPAIIFNTY